MSEIRSPIARFDGAAAWPQLSREQQNEIGAIALELVAGWLAMPGPGDVGLTPTFRAAEHAVGRLTSGLIDRATDVLGLEGFQLLGAPGIPSLIGRICEDCGCSEYDACPGGCSWVARNLCSTCHARGVR